VPRPVRPAQNWKDGNYLGTDPATTEKKHRPVDPKTQRALIARVGDTQPEER